jgi:hypothetical protein
VVSWNSLQSGRYTNTSLWDKGHIPCSDETAALVSFGNMPYNVTIVAPVCHVVRLCERSLSFLTPRVAPFAGNGSPAADRTPVAPRLCEKRHSQPHCVPPTHLAPARQ